MAALWRKTLIDAAILRKWIVNVGSHPARMRIAHLIAEMFERFRSAGLTDEDGFVLPTTQAELGEATGMCSVHVNRILQELRAERLIASEGRFLRILDWPGLKQVACYEPTHLHLATLRTPGAFCEPRESLPRAGTILHSSLPHVSALDTVEQ